MGKAVKKPCSKPFSGKLDTHLFAEEPASGLGAVLGLTTPVGGSLSTPKKSVSHFFRRVSQSLPPPGGGSARGGPRSVTLPKGIFKGQKWVFKGQKKFSGRLRRPGGYPGRPPPPGGVPGPQVSQSLRKSQSVTPGGGGVRRVLSQALHRGP